MSLKNIRYTRLETEESEGDEDESPPTHVVVNNESLYVKGSHIVNNLRVAVNSQGSILERATALVRVWETNVCLFYYREQVEPH